jgi:hypothetical protein
MFPHLRNPHWPSPDRSVGAFFSVWPFDVFQYLVADKISVQCELRDVIYNAPWGGESAQLSSLYLLCANLVLPEFFEKFVILLPIG